jgi:hypothetical protein
MPEAALWSLIIALAMLCLGLTLKNAELRFRLKKLEKDTPRTGPEVDPINKLEDKKITTIGENGEALYHNNLLWFSADNTPLCPRCYEVDKTRVHMKLKTFLVRPAQYICPRCTYSASYTEHLEVNSTPKKSTATVKQTNIKPWQYG